MGIGEIFMLALALSMDACAVAMSNGMAHSKMPVKQVLLIGLFFGFFQFLMPVIGYFITEIVANAFLDSLTEDPSVLIEKISAWVSFGLLAFLGGKMLYEGIKELIEAKNAPTNGCENCQTVGAGTSLTEKNAQKELTYGKLFMQAIATSIDALAVGVTLQMAAISPGGLALGVWGSTAVIGVTTFILSVGSVYIGKVVGDKLADKASFFGGLVLLAIGIKLLLEGML
jgi:putative Mn2+ efflux pump MntP